MSEGRHPHPLTNDKLGIFSLSWLYRTPAEPVWSWLLSVTMRHHLVFGTIIAVKISEINQARYITMRNNLPIIGVAAFVVSLFAGCASIPEAYRPQEVGSLQPARVASGLKVSISPDSEIAVRGEPIQFSVNIENVSGHDLVLPRRPHIQFAWTYSNGRRDNFVSEIPAEQFYRPSEVITLESGGKLRVNVPVKTYYFDQMGITEFHAVVKSPRNTNPALGPVWQGSVASNRYGVRVTRGRDYAWLH